MGVGEQTRASIVAAATRLFQQRGYAATGLSEILSESGAPRGSLYHHFPGGKVDLATAVVRQHGAAIHDGLAALLSQPQALPRVLAQGLDLLAQSYGGASCPPGCPISAVALEMSTQSPELRQAAEEAFESWRRVVAARLVSDGLSKAKAAQRARLLVSMVVGAVVLCRAYGDRGPLDDIKKQLPLLTAG